MTEKELHKKKIRYECKECGKKHYAKAYRVKKFELQEV